MIKLLNLMITKLEVKTKNSDKKELYRKMLSAIDSYYYKKGILKFRYYRYENLKVDSIKYKRGLDIWI